MIAERPYIIYTLPQSKMTQALIGGKIEKVWDKVQKFLTNCTTAIIDNPDSTYLTAFSAAEDHGELPELADKLLRRTKDVFGAGQTSPIGNLWPQNVPTKQTKTTWDVKSNECSKPLNI